jgi:hypothetical protein
VSLEANANNDIGFFPNAVAKPTRKLYEYNIAEEAAQVIAGDS